MNKYFWDKEDSDLIGGMFMLVSSFLFSLIILEFVKN
jgi:hypothetical protein